MKNIILKISVLAFIFTGATSCDSELDQIPFDEFGNENAYVSAADFENAIRGAYAGFASGAMYGGSDAGGMIDAGDVLADNVTTAQAGRGTRRNLHNWRYVAADGPLSNIYQQTYNIVNRTNLILENIVDFDGDNKVNITAEAKALRALAHFNSVIFFGKIPTQSGDANGSLGIAYVTEVDANQLPTRETVGATYDMIVSDLTDALAGINETTTIMESFLSSPLSISNNQVTSTDIKLIPNPVEDVVNISINQNNPIRYATITDISGRRILTINESFASISVSNLQAGIYIANITTDNGVYTKKFLKK